jgi:hypothetical protein
MSSKVGADDTAITTAASSHQRSVSVRRKLSWRLELLSAVVKFATGELSDIDQEIARPATAAMRRTTLFMD